MKKYLFIALAALGFAACAEKDEMGKQPIQNGEKEQSYMAVTFTADGVTRATEDGKFAEGTEAERAVMSAYVFFFEENGKAFYVTDGDTSVNGGPKNYIEVELEKDGKNMNNVSDIHKSVLVLKNYKGKYPAQVVAVLNWTPTDDSYTLENLQAKITALGNDTDGYVMSNAVYMDFAGKAKYATDLRIENIVKRTAGESEDDAKARAAASPVVIQVERVAAKVEFGAKDGGKFHVGEVNGEPVYAQITGFELYNDYEESWLIKKINTSWSNIANFGMTNTWNDADWKRSYWATSLGKPFENNTFTWNHNTDAEKYNSTKFEAGNAAPLYCGENTREWDEANDVRTKVIVKAKLVKTDNSAVNLVNWYGKYYVGEDTVKAVVANTLANNYYYATDSTAQNFIGIEGTDIECTMRNVGDAKAFEVYFQLSSTGANKTWYKYENGDYTYIDVPTMNNILASVEPALVYNNGMTYYYTDIKHLGTTGSTTEFGVVRNHVYRVNITDIKGYGTPVYDGTTGFLTPEKPEDVSTYVAAQINILSWRVVDPGYEI